MTRFPPAIIDPASFTDVTDDSRRVKQGSIFVAYQGSLLDGHAFIPDAIRRGATAIVHRAGMRVKRVPGLSFFAVDDPRAELAVLLRLFYGDVFGGIPKIGITGTNGKTTSATMLAVVMSAAGLRPVNIGTIGCFFEGGVIETDNTTPGLADLSRIMADGRARGADALVMEVSSHALDQERIRGIRFTAGLFTNLTRDHLDYHTSMEAYYRAKRKLFTRHLAAHGTGVANIDDPFGARLVRDCTKVTWITYGVTAKKAMVRPHDVTITLRGIKGSIVTPRGTLGLHSPLTGTFNLANILGVVATAQAIGIDNAVIERSVNRFTGARGRLERVEDKRFHLFVDYAHTPDALVNVLDTLRATAKGRIIAVFGAGGDRDRGKRPEMAKAVERYADIAIVTSDNPRTESPRQIFDDVVAGFSKRASFELIDDRRRAIERAVALARRGDTILIAGKGHEEYQIVGTTRHHFSDFEVAREVLSSRP